MPDVSAGPPAGRGGLNLVEYAAEAWALGLFMVSAAGFGVLLFHPGSPVVAAWPDPVLRRVLMGLAMGLTAAANIYSPWGRRSGAHMNPALTWTFYRLGKVARADLYGYVVAQFAGGLLGMVVAVYLFGGAIADPAVNYVVTMPGVWGTGAAFLGEVMITSLLLAVVLWLSVRPRLARFTGLVAGALVATYIAVESPVSGMSMNPARTLGSAAVAGQWHALWLYFVAPPLGMWLAVVFRRRLTGGAAHCAKYDHDSRYRCIFCEHTRRGASAAATDLPA